MSGRAGGVEEEGRGGPYRVVHRRAAELPVGQPTVQPRGQVAKTTPSKRRRRLHQTTKMTPSNVIHAEHIARRDSIGEQGNI